MSEEPLIIGQDFFLGDRIDLTYCECSMCSEFRRRLIAAEEPDG